MARPKTKISPTALKQTGDIFYDTYNGINYIGSSTCCVYGLSDVELEELKSKIKTAEHRDDYGKKVAENVNVVMDFKKEVDNTLIQYGTSGKNLYHLFKCDGKVVALSDIIYNVINDLTIETVFGASPLQPLIFELRDKFILCMPNRLDGTYNKTLRKLLDMIEEM